MRQHASSPRREQARETLSFGTDDSADGRSFCTTFGRGLRSIVGSIAIRERLFGAACREHLRDSDVDQLIDGDALRLRNASSFIEERRLKAQREVALFHDGLSIVVDITSNIEFTCDTTAY
jgi:hypothetical protein